MYVFHAYIYTFLTKSLCNLSLHQDIYFYFLVLKFSWFSVVLASGVQQCDSFLSSFPLQFITEYLVPYALQ